MKFALVGGYHDDNSLALARSCIIRAEELGYDIFTVGDHYINPFSNWHLDAWTYLGYAAATTKSIKIGTLVTPIPLRSPAILAKVVASLDVLSEGRVMLGVGAGYVPEEFKAYSQWDEAGVRVSKTLEGLDLMRRLWTGQQVNFRGKYYSSTGGVCLPEPRQKPHPQLWFGSSQPRMMRALARFGQGWIPGSLPPEVWREKWKELLSTASEFGRKDQIEGGSTLVVADGMRPQDVPLSARDPSKLDKAVVNMKQSVKRIEEYAEAGVSSIFVFLFPTLRYTELMQVFAKEIIPSFR
ncbi:MAG: LLM class flavin-dependent oxidoreductase [Nitrososphaerota archaeon]|nr:LLM class flavin-dependent oxidoreductase [Nitrososphaerota archaeon]MDG6921764.1 LLM class flavin-dependent oxidoreductase [Nitrososphaerota archaeon]